VLGRPAALSSVARGQVATRAQGRRPWGRISTLFAVILKRVFSRNLDQYMLKNAYIWKKL